MSPPRPPRKTRHPQRSSQGSAEPPPQRSAGQDRNPPPPSRGTGRPPPPPRSRTRGSQPPYRPEPGVRRCPERRLRGDSRRQPLLPDRDLGHEKRRCPGSAPPGGGASCQSGAPHLSRSRWGERRGGGSPAAVTAGRHADPSPPAGSSRPERRNSSRRHPAPSLRAGRTKSHRDLLWGLGIPPPPAPAKSTTRPRAPAHPGCRGRALSARPCPPRGARGRAAPPAPARSRPAGRGRGARTRPSLISPPPLL